MEESIGDDDDSETHHHHHKEGDSKQPNETDENNEPDFKCLLVTGHNDSSIKIWNENVNIYFF